MLLLKLFLVPSLIALLTLAGRRWGPAVAGWLSGFPVVLGPVLLVLGLEQGPVFASRTAHSALATMLGTVAFCLVYARAAVRFPWHVSAAAGSLSFIAAAMLLSQLSLSLWAALALAIGGLFAAPAVFPRVEFVPHEGRAARGELAARMLAGAALSITVTVSAQRLGPTFSGVLSVFPVIGLVFGVFSHLAWGGKGAVVVLQGMVRSLHAFAAFCFTAAVAMPRGGVLTGCLAALGAALIVQGLTFRRR